MIKKKIKDLTKKELKCVCMQSPYCGDCPLEIHKGIDSICIKGVLDHLNEFNRRIEKEIMVEDE